MDKSVVVSIGVFALVLIIMFGLSAVVTVYDVPTDSMEPSIEQNSKIVAVDTGNYDGLEEGDVIIFRPNGDETEPLVVHRVVTHVEEGDDWTTTVDSEYHPGDSCDVVQNCPAPNSGYITLGDNNFYYDQHADKSKPVKPSWIEGVVWYP